MRRARARGIRVAFHLHNFGDRDRIAFEHADVVIFPSEFSRRHHARLLGLDGPVIPYPIDVARLVVPESERDPRYVTFVNPQPAKGMTVLARIAIEPSARRPDIPILVVEGRGTADALQVSMATGINGQVSMAKVSMATRYQWPRYQWPGTQRR